MASRAQLVALRIAPALAAGRCVLADRFYSSTLAYQGTAGASPPARSCKPPSSPAATTAPISPSSSMSTSPPPPRALNPLLDRMESKGPAFHARVRQGYLDQARDDPDRVVLIDATRSEDEVFDALVATLDRRLNLLPGARP